MNGLHGDQQPVAAPGTGPVAIGMPVSRVDGVAKVTGHARYAAELRRKASHSASS